MSRLEISWPDEGAERVRAAQARLVRAGEDLRAMSLEERLTAVADVLREWTTVDSPWRRELAATLAAATPFHPATLAEGLDSALRAWRPERLVECVRRELAPALQGGGRVLVPYEWTTVVAGGSIPMPTLLSGLLPLIVGSPVLLRETSKDPVTARLLARCLATRSDPLARAFEPIAFASSDRAAYDVALAAPCVVATGSDETLREITARLDPRTRLVAYGHRFSIVVLGPHVSATERALREMAVGIALDVARWDQSGCLSPVVVYLLEIEPEVSERIARAISRALDDLAESLPRGEVDPETRAAIATERSEARMRSASGRGMLCEGRTHTIVLENDSRPRPAPLHRFLRLVPVASRTALLDALAPFAGRLSTVGLSGLASPDPRTREPAGDGLGRESDPDALLDAMSRLGVSRFTFPGRMQCPPVDWPHDGMPLVTPLARFADFVDAEATGL